LDSAGKSKEELQLLQDKASLIAVKIFTISPSADEAITMFHESLKKDTPVHLKEDVLTEDFLRFVDSTLATGYIATYTIIAMSVLQNFTEEQIEEAVRMCSDPKWDVIAKAIAKVGTMVSSQKRPLSESMNVVLTEFHRRLKSAEIFDYKAYIPPIGL
jgi:hypothetical protein